jgi:catechol 2,3-dioxygenase-like lactoylglutathione lyase family enzyme
MKIRGIDFVVVNVADADASLRFYREVVGIDAPLTEESPN